MAGRLGKRLVEMFELPKEVVFNLPIIQAVGSEDINITNYKGLLEYNSECVRVTVGSGIIRFEGAGLILRQITSETISISGRVKKIEFLQ